jgi:hypothetical protein
MPNYPPHVQEKIRQAARALALKKGYIRKPNREEVKADAPRPARPRVLLTDLMIRTKDKRVVPFIPNQVQTSYLDKEHPEWREGLFNMKGLREIILKGRQFGFSTLILGMLFLDTVNNDNTESVLVAHDAESTEKMFRMIHLFHERLPDAKRPATRRSNRRELVYSDINSTFRVMTAGTGTAGHSSTINNLHCSELSRWESEEIFVGLMQAVTAEGNVFEESTANGEGFVETGVEGEEIISGSFFHVYYTKAKLKLGDFKAHFFPWFAHDEYQKTPPPGFKLTNASSEAKDLLRYGNETEIKAKFGLSDAQMCWRHDKINEQGMGPGNFKSQYPATDVECFQVSGLKFFEDWDESVHVIDPFPIPDEWERISGYDWGFGAPYCYLTGVIDPNMNVIVTHEQYETRVTDPEQAVRVRDLAVSQKAFDSTVWADQSIWSVKVNTDGTTAANVDAFLDQGLCMVQAVKNTQHAWANVRSFLREAVKEPDYHGGKSRRSVRIFRPDGKGAGCPRLIQFMPMMKKDPMKPEKMLEVFNRRPVADHAPATLSYMLSPFIVPGEHEQDQVKSLEQQLMDDGMLKSGGGAQREMWG